MSDDNVAPAPASERAVRALLRTAFVYGLLVWVYISANSLVHHETLAMPLTHFFPWPLEGDTGLAAFVLSAAAFAALRAWPSAPVQGST